MVMSYWVAERGTWRRPPRREAFKTERLTGSFALRAESDGIARLLEKVAKDFSDLLREGVDVGVAPY
jgi:hypothetical protein